MVVGMIIFPKARCLFDLCYKELSCICWTELAGLDPLKDEVPEMAQYRGENANSFQEPKASVWYSQTSFGGKGLFYSILERSVSSACQNMELQS